MSEYTHISKAQVEPINYEYKCSKIDLLDFKVPMKRNFFELMLIYYVLTRVAQFELPAIFLTFFSTTENRIWRFKNGSLPRLQAVSFFPSESVEFGSSSGEYCKRKPFRNC